MSAQGLLALFRPRKFCYFANFKFRCLFRHVFLRWIISRSTKILVDTNFFQLFYKSFFFEFSSFDVPVEMQMMHSFTLPLCRLSL